MLAAFLAVVGLAAVISVVSVFALRRRPPATHETKVDTSSHGTLVNLSHGSGGYSIGIVGESYRQTALRKLAGGRRQRGEDVTFMAVLIPESDNAYDPNAIAVHLVDGPRLGYLSRDDAAAYQAPCRLLASQRRVGVCHAKLIGGTSTKPSIGVILDLRDPNDLIAVLDPNGQPF